MHLAMSEHHTLTTRQIAGMHDAKYNHLAKVTQWLVKEGYVDAMRGRSGGLRLARTPEQINVGEVLRALESQSDLVECMRADGGNCVLAPNCGLQTALSKARDAFFSSLCETSLGDLTERDLPMARLLLRLNES